MERTVAVLKAAEMPSEGRSGAVECSNGLEAQAALLRLWRGLPRFLLSLDESMIFSQPYSDLPYSIWYSLAGQPILTATHSSSLKPLARIAAT